MHEHEIVGEGVRVAITPGGACRLMIGDDVYPIHSSFSFPSPTIGYHRLDQSPAQNQWRRSVTRLDASELQLHAVADHYTLRRRVRLTDRRIDVSDLLTNTSNRDVAIRICHDIEPSGMPREILLAGIARQEVRQIAENPSILMRLKESGIGVIAEDTLSRLGFQAAASQNAATFSFEHFALRPGQAHLFEWSIYPLEAGAGYFDFINRVRQDWGGNFKIQGPWSKFDTIGLWDIWNNPARLRAYLQRKRHGFITLSPWLDYDNYNARAGRPMSREEYLPHMQRVMVAFKSAQPSIRCTGCMEGNLVSLPAERMADFYGALGPDERSQGIRPFNDRMMQIIKDVPLRWKDCLLTGPDGRYTYEVYYPRPDKPLMAIAVYAAPDNDQHKYWMDQARFMLEEVGFDGVYIDQFSLAFHDKQRYTYDRWDGHTVDIDPRTGEIARRYADCSLLGVGARKRLIEYVLSRRDDAVMVANTHAAAREVQAEPISRFTEAEWFFNPLEWTEGSEPPALSEICKAHLASPLALGYRVSRLGEAGMRDYARVIMKSVIAYLRMGVLYYHFRTEIPETGEGAGEYGPINHMFPITPVELGKGWVRGQERIITAISRQFHWPQANKPRCLLFDITGRSIPTDNLALRRDQAGESWTISINLRDWAEIAVIEQDVASVPSLRPH